jgi:hypothetical protein
MRTKHTYSVLQQGRAVLSLIYSVLQHILRVIKRMTDFYSWGPHPLLIRPQLWWLALISKQTQLEPSAINSHSRTLQHVCEQSEEVVPTQCPLYIMGMPHTVNVFAHCFQATLGAINTKLEALRRQYSCASTCCMAVCCA